MFSTNQTGKKISGESKEHRDLIEMMASHFKKQGYTYIRADLLGYTKPDSVTDAYGNKYIPDLTCDKNGFGGTRIILEAETCGTINDSHTADQWRAFYNAQGEFHVVVPKLCGGQSGRDKARARLQELGISADVVWIPE